MKNRYKIILTLVVLFYIPLTPIFIQSNYYSQPHSDINVGKSHAYLWVLSQRKFHYYFLFGSNNKEYSKKINFMVYDENAQLKQIIIQSMQIKIDNTIYDVPKSQYQTIDMDTSIHNMYGGNGASGMIKGIEIPHKPKQVEIIVQGTAVDVNNKTQPIILNVKSTLTEESTFVIPLFLSMLWSITQT